MIDDSITKAEVSLCGELLNYPVKGRELLPDYLVPEDFREDACRAVFMALKAIFREGLPVEPVTLHAKMEQLGKVVTEDALRLMDAYGISSANIVQHASIIHTGALRRRLEKLCEDISNDQFTPLDEQLNTIKQQTNQIASLMNFSKPLSSSAEEFTYSKPNWLMEPYFQMGKGTLIQSDPGVGKTAFMCAIAAAVTTGRDVLGLPVQKPGNVVILSAEDDLGVIRGRLEANGADLRRVFLVHEPYKLTFNSPEVERLIVERNARLIVFDPMQAFLGAKVDLFRANETRPILTALFDVCAKHDCACAIIAHLSKSTMGKSAVNQSLGSVDIPGAMRSIIHIVQHPTIDQKMAVHIKSSNAARGKTIAYSIGKKGSVNWLELTDDTLDSIVSPGAKEEPCEYEKNVFLPVLLDMRDNNRQNCFWSYDDLRGKCMEKLGYVPFQSSRELSNLLNADFLHQLEIRECLQVKLSQKSNGKRGLRLLTMPKIGDDPLDETQHLSQKDYDELMSFLDQQEDWTARADISG